MPGPGGDPWWPVRDRFDGRFSTFGQAPAAGRKRVARPCPHLRDTHRESGLAGVLLRTGIAMSY